MWPTPTAARRGRLLWARRFRLIRAGGAQVVLAGGVEAPLAPLTFGAFSIIKVMSARNDTPETASRPFDAGRDGFVMAEGGCMLVLEELGHAVRRGARIYAELEGYGLTNDAHHMTAPLPSGAQSAGRSPWPCVRLAWSHSRSVMSTLTPVPRRSTTGRRLWPKRALGDHAYHTPISGTKGMHGHTLGATGAMEAAICCLAFCHSYLPPTVNLTSPDADCDLDYVPGYGRHRAVQHILTNSFGFGGINAALVLGRAP